jgi:hypothetical protein
MSAPKIDKIKLSRMLGRGKTLTQCAKHFGVSPTAILKAKRKLGVIVAKDIQLESVHRFVGEYLDTVGQLRKINADAHELLDLCMGWVRGDGDAIQVLESQISTKKVRRGGNEKRVGMPKMQDPNVVALKAMGEIRSQLTSLVSGNDNYQEKQESDD